MSDLEVILTELGHIKRVDTYRMSGTEVICKDGGCMI